MTTTGRHPDPDTSPPRPSSAPRRRAMLRGAAWATPSVVVSAVAPAYAASFCTPQSQQAIDAAFSTANTAGALEVNFYQILESGNGALGQSFANLKNVGTTTLTYSGSNPLVLTVHVLTTAGPLNTTRSKSLTPKIGTLTRLGFDASTGIERYQWTITSSIAPGAEPDITFDWRDGATGRGRLNNAVQITPLTAGEPTAASILTAPDQRQQCAGVYGTALASWRSSTSATSFRYRGPKGSGTLTVGSSVRSDTIGDYWGASRNGDGIY